MRKIVSHEFEYDLHALVELSRYVLESFQDEMCEDVLSSLQKADASIASAYVHVRSDYLDQHGDELNN